MIGRMIAKALPLRAIGAAAGNAPRAGAVARELGERLRSYGYATEEIRISTVIIPMLAGAESIPAANPRYEYAKALKGKRHYKDERASLGGE